jgi:hypothetical protein
MNNNDLIIGFRGGLNLMWHFFTNVKSGGTHTFNDVEINALRETEIVARVFEKEATNASLALETILDYMGVDEFTTVNGRKRIHVYRAQGGGAGVIVRGEDEK